MRRIIQKLKVPMMILAMRPWMNDFTSQAWISQFCLIRIKLVIICKSAKTTPGTEESSNSY